MECKRAYQALSDTKQRSRYDREQVIKHCAAAPQFTVGMKCV